MNAEAAPPRTPPMTPYEALGGREAIQRFVDRFYDLMVSDPAYAELRAMHAEDLAPMRASLTGFLSGWAGGPRDWFDRNPGKCMMSAHSGLGVTRQTAQQWSEAMTRAIADCGPEDAEIGRMLTDQLSMMARAMAG